MDPLTTEDELKRESPPPPYDGLPSPKIADIVGACKRGSLDDLKTLAESKGGFLSDSLRQKAWPILLGLARDDNNHEAEAATSSVPWQKLEPHRDEGQVKLDVDRAFVHYPARESPPLDKRPHDKELSANTDIDKSEAEESLQKAELSALIVEVLRRHPHLCYFQGFHDICQVFLLVLAPRQRAPAVARLSLLRIRDFMLPRIDPAVAQLQLIPDLLRAADPALWRHLSHTKPFFALSGTLTMYAHDVTSLGEIARLFDVLLAREPVFSVYMFAAIVRGRRAELFDTPADEPEMLHSILSKLPKALDLDALIAAAVRLADDHPPESLRSWRWGISAHSVLKTARTLDDCAAQSMEDGEGFFRGQVREMEMAARRKEIQRMMWKHRGPIRAVGLAIAVGVIAVWLRRSAWPAPLLSTLTNIVSRWTAS